MKRRTSLRKDHRPWLIFHKTRANRYTLPVLIGCLETGALHRQFRILLANSLQEIPIDLRAGAIVAYSFMTPHLGQVRAEVQELRKTRRGTILLLAGGSHATADPEGTRRLGFDFVFAGEAETSWPLFLRQYLGGKLPDSPIVSSQGGPGGFAPPFSPGERLFGPMEISRGCLNNCAFCQTPRIFGRRLRHRSTASVAAHLKEAVPYGYRHAFFISSNAFAYGAAGPGGPDLKRIEELLDACREAGVQGVHFGCFPSEVRPDWVTPEIMQLVKSSCCNQTIVLGAQSGSDSLLKKIQRGHTAARARQAVQWIRRAGFMPHVDFVFGFPGETMEDRRLSLEQMAGMIREDGAKIHAHSYLPLPATPLFRETPSILDDETKNALQFWEEKRKLDGWWKEQERIAWKIVAWRDAGEIGEAMEVGKMENVKCEETT